MIAGTIDRNLEAKIKLQVVNKDRIEEVEFLVDTGFNGFVAVPFSLVQRLDLELGAVQSGVTADGRSGYFDTVAVEFYWHGVTKRVQAQVLDEPLIGTRLLNGHEVFAEWFVGGEFRISDRLI